MSEFLSTAFVEIRPRPVKGFSQQLRTQIARSLPKTAVPVGIRPDFTGFRTALRTGIARSSKGVPVKVLVVPDTKGFRAALLTQIATAKKGVVVGVPVVPVGGAAAAGATVGGRAARAAGGAERELSATRALNQEKKIGETLDATRAAQASRFAQIQARTTKLLVTDIAGLSKRSQLQKISNALSHEEALLNKLNEKALAAENVELQQQVGLLLEDIAVRQSKIAVQREELAANSNLIRQQKLAARGAAATSLSLLGVRGATLAASGAFLAGAAAIALFAKSVASAAALETQLSVFRATTGATADAMERVREQAIALGRDITLPSVNAQDAADAMTELAKAGLSVQDSIDGARGVLQLATAANISNAEATQLAASALNAFGLAGRDAQRVADVLANAANQAQGSISDMGAALGQASAVARLVGISLEDTNVFLTALARAGLRGSDAGTSLRTSLIRLINPTKEAQQIFDRLGIAIRDTEGNLRPEFFTNLGIALEGMGRAQRDATLATIGGQDALRALSILSRLNIQQLIRLRGEISKQGTAADVAAARTQGLAGAAEALRNTLATTGTGLGQKVTPALTDFTNGITASIEAISRSETAGATFASSIDAISNAFGAFSSTLQFVSPALLTVANAAGQVVVAIGVTEILAAAAAYKLLSAAIKADIFATVGARALYAAGSIGSFTTSVRTAGSVSAGLRVGLSGLAAGLTSLVSPATALTVALAAVTAGIVYLATREGALERAHRHLAEASDALVQSLGDLNLAQDAVATSASDQSSAEVALQSALLARVQAQRALAGAPEGTFERRQAANQLAIANDNVRLAELRLADARRRAKTDLEGLAQAERNRADELRDARSAILEVIGREEGLARALDQEILGRQRIISALRKQAAENRRENTEFTRDLAKRQEALANFINEFQRAPTAFEIDVILNSRNLQEAARKLAESGEEGADAYIETFLRGTETLGPRLTSAIKAALEATRNQFKISGFEHGRGYGGAVVDGAKAVLNERLSELSDAANRAAGRATGLQSQLDVITIGGGGEAARRAGLVAIQQQRQRELDLIFQAIAASPVGETPQLRKRKREAQAALAQVIEEIRGIDEQMASDAEQAAKDAESKQEERNQALLDLLGVKRQKIANRLLVAQATEGLGDDISVNKTLRATITKQIALLQARVRALRALGKTVEPLNAAIAELKQARFELNLGIADLARQRQGEIRDQVRRGLQLDIDFAETIESQKLEVRARRRLIASLEKEAADLRRQKKLTIEQKNRLKEIRNEIAAQRKEIEGIIKERKNITAKMQFEFLQTQTGFVANLLGNLIPLGSTGGLVGGTSGVGAPRPSPTGISTTPTSSIPSRARLPFEHGRGQGPRPEQDLARVEAGTGGGPTKTLQAREIHLLNQIVHLLQMIHRGTGHPESHNVRRKHAGEMDMI